MSTDEAEAFNAAGEAGATAVNRLTTLADLECVLGLWSDAEGYIYPDNVGNGFQITDTGNLFLEGNIYLNNNRAYYIKNTAGKFLNVAYVDTSDDLQLGHIELGDIRFQVGVNWIAVGQ